MTTTAEELLQKILAELAALNKEVATANALNTLQRADANHITNVAMRLADSPWVLLTPERIEAIKAVLAWGEVGFSGLHPELVEMQMEPKHFDIVRAMMTEARHE